MYAMNIQNDVIGLVLHENCKSKLMTDIIAWPSRCHGRIYNFNMYIKPTFSVSIEWPLYTGLTMYHLISSTFRRKKVELLSSLRRQRLQSASGSVKFSVKFFVRVHFSKTIKDIHLKLGNLFTIKRGTNYNKADDPVICISRVICPCFDIVHGNWGYFVSI